MKAADLLRRLRRLANRRGWKIDVTEGGSHTKILLNGRRSVVPRHGADMKAGTLRGILKQLDLTAADLED